MQQVLEILHPVCNKTYRPTQTQPKLLLQVFPLWEEDTQIQPKLWHGQPWALGQQ
jgi:hypothetical protein